MNYGELKNVVGVLNTGANNPGQFALLTKLILGKIASKRLSSRIKIGEITTSGATSFVLTTSLADFLAPKIETGNNNKWVYYLDNNSNAIFLVTKPYSFLKENPSALVSAKEGNTLYISNDTSISKIYIPYYSKYLVLDKDGSTEKETPENDDDTILLPSEFDDVLVDGLLLYISRREKKDSEFNKTSKAWEIALSNLIFLQ